MSELTPFVKYFVEEAHKRQSLAELLDSDINKPCYEIQDIPVNITPRIFSQNPQFQYQNPQTLYVYPSKEDSLDYLLKAEQLVESLHGISKQVTFEIPGNKKEIACCFYGEDTDIKIIDSAIRNFQPKTITNTEQTKILSGDFLIFDLLPNAPFYKSLTSYKDFIISPLNIIPQILFNIESNIGAYQVLFTPVPGHCHDLVQEAIDTEWKAMLGADHQIPPSLQPNAVNKEIDYKSKDFKSYFSVCVRLILPMDSFDTAVKAFISSYTYGSKALRVLDNQHYSQDQILKMLNNRVSYHTGFLVNSHELTSFLHIPYQILNNKEFNEIFAAAPCGDKPVKTTEYEDIPIGTWACGNSNIETHLPEQREIAHVHIMGVSRSGKSILLGNIAIEKFKKGEAVFIFDPHGDLIDNILKTVPKKLIDKVVVIDFGLKDLTPQITIRGNVDIANPSKVSDDLTESMRDVASSREKFWGPRMAYAFLCLYYIYSTEPDLDLTHIRLIISSSRKAKVLRTKVKARISHPIVLDFLEELENMPYEAMMPVITRLSHLLLDEKSLRLFTLEQNKISINDIMENGKLCLINLSCGIIGKQRSSILSGLMDSLINNNALARAAIPYEERKPCTIIKDEFYLGPGDLDAQLTGLAKYNLSIIFAHQYLNQVEGRTQEVMATAGSRIMFKLRRKDAEIMGRDFGIEPEEFTNLRKFQAIAKIEDEVVKINTPKPVLNPKDHSKKIMQNCIKKYYLRHSGKGFSEKKKLSYDKL